MHDDTTALLYYLAMSEFEGDGSPSSGGGLRRGRVGGISSGKMADMLAAADEPAGISPAAAGAS